MASTEAEKPGVGPASTEVRMMSFRLCAYFDDFEFAGLDFHELLLLQLLHRSGKGDKSLSSSMTT